VNYRHIFHAGNFADVVKHAALALVIEHLKRKSSLFAVIDTHAGAGRYDLSAAEAERTGEYHEGIERVLALPAPPMELAPYLAVVRALNRSEGGGLRWYPGSPCLALIRPGDRLLAVELHPVDYETLAAEFRADRRVKTVRLDGYQALAAFVPPHERRAVVLVDPPFEQPGEFDRLSRGLIAAHRRFSTGVYLVWYPIKEPAPIERFHHALAESGMRRILLAEFAVRRPTLESSLTGCGLIAINPPFNFAQSLERCLDALLPVLAQGAGGARLAWFLNDAEALRRGGSNPASGCRRFGLREFFWLEAQ
jgi:23S rRNA (adenine2030-N6)-methyltransferase